MGLKDPHDSRTFTHFAKLNPDGTVAAIVEVADSALPNFDPGADGNCYVDVTDLRTTGLDVYALTVDPSLVIPGDSKSVAAIEAMTTAATLASAKAGRPVVAPPVVTDGDQIQ